MMKQRHVLFHLGSTDIYYRNYARRSNKCTLKNFKTKNLIFHDQYVLLLEFLIRWESTSF